MEGFPKVVGYPDKAGEYRWRLVGGNGEIQATGEGFETKEHCQESVDSVATNFLQVAGIEEEDGAAHIPVDWITTKEAMQFDEGLQV